MPEAQHPADRTPAQREADHASLAHLSETLVPALVQKLNGSGLGELEVREGAWRVRLRRPSGGVAASAPTRRPDRPRLAAHGPERDARPARDAGSPDGAAVVTAGDRRAIATSPAVGVFRPGAAIGTHVRSGDRIAIVDLLGIPQDVVAPIDGTVAEVLVQAGEAVEYGEAVASIEADAEDARGAGESSGEG